MPNKNQKCKKWREPDNTFIKNNYEKMTVKELSEKFGVSNKAMRSKMERLNLNLEHLGRIKKCDWSSEDIQYLKENWMYMYDKDIAKHLGEDRGFNAEIVGRKRLSLGLKGKSNRVRTDKSGYKYHIDYDKRVFTHRENMSKSLGRELSKEEIVHHLDGDKGNDDLSNLLLTSAGEHQRLHDQLEKIGMNLFKSGFIKFDFDKREYYLVDSLLTRTEG